MRNLIGGIWKESLSKRRIKSVNPADDKDVVGGAPKSNRKDADHGVQAAHSAQQSWSLLGASHRGEYLYAMADALHLQRERLADTVSRESGKLRQQVLHDIEIAQQCARRCASTITLSVQLDAHETHRTLINSRRPHGVIAILPSWRDPILSICEHTFLAIASGNTCVIKAHTLLPLSSGTLVEILASANLPEGVLNLIHGPAELAKYIASHALVDVVATDDQETKRIVVDVATSNAKTLLQSWPRRDAMIITQQADIDLAVASAVQSALEMNGQARHALKRIILHSSIADAFITKFLGTLELLKLGPALDGAANVGPIINDATYKLCKERVSAVRRKENTPVIYESMHVIKTPKLHAGRYHDLVVFGEAKSSNSLDKLPIVGPVLSMSTYQKPRDALRAANAGIGCGVLSIYTSDLSLVESARQFSTARLITVNTPTTDIDVSVRCGMDALYAYSIPQTTCIDSGNAKLDIKS